MFAAGTLGAELFTWQCVVAHDKPRSSPHPQSGLMSCYYGACVRPLFFLQAGRSRWSQTKETLGGTAIVARYTLVCVQRQTRSIQN